MNFLTKIVVWISVAMITGFFNCGLALAEDDSTASVNSQSNNNKKEIVPVVSSDPFDRDTLDKEDYNNPKKENN